MHYPPWWCHLVSSTPVHSLSCPFSLKSIFIPIIRDSLSTSQRRTIPRRSRFDRPPAELPLRAAKPTPHSAYTPYNSRYVSIKVIVVSRYFSFCCTYPYHMCPLSVLTLELSSLLRVQHYAMEWTSAVHACVNRI